MATAATVAQQAVRTVSAGTPEARAAQVAVRTLSADYPATGRVAQVVVRTLSASVSVTIASVTPLCAPVSGGTTVTITGTGFVEGATVTFDGVSATNVVVVSQTELTCTTPAHAYGYVDVVVTSSGSTATLEDEFRYLVGYLYDSLTVLSIVPDHGPEAGGSEVIIFGTEFDVFGVVTVTFDGVAATNITVVNSTTIVCRTPAGTGVVDVTVSQGGDSATLVGGFTYEAAMSGFILIESVERSTWAMQGNVTVKQSLSSRPTASIVFRDKKTSIPGPGEPNPAYRPAVREDILIQIDGTDVFGGIIYKPTQRGPHSRLLMQDVDAVGYLVYAEKCVVDRTWGGAGVVAGVHGIGTTSIVTLEMPANTTLKAGSRVNVDTDSTDYVLAADVTVAAAGAATLTLTVGLVQEAADGARIDVKTLSKTILQELVADWLTDYDITVDAGMGDGSWLTELAYDNGTAAEVIADVCQRTGWVYEVSPTKVLKAYAPGTVLAPWDVGPAVHSMTGEPVLEPSMEDYADKVVLVCGGTTTKCVGNGVVFAHGSDAVKADGIPATPPLVPWPDDYRYFYLPYATVNDVDSLWPASIAVGGAPAVPCIWAADAVPDTVWVFEAVATPHRMQIGPIVWVYASRIRYNANTGGGEIAAGTALWINGYTIQYPLKVVADIGNAMPWETVVTDEKTTASQAAIDGAKAVLDVRSATKNVLTYSTTTPGLWPGQMQHIEIPERNVHEDYLITDVEFKHEVSRVDGSWTWRYTITATEGDTFLASWKDYYRLLGT